MPHWGRGAYFRGEDHPQWLCSHGNAGQGCPPSRRGRPRKDKSYERGLSAPDAHAQRMTLSEHLPEPEQQVHGYASSEGNQREDLELGRGDGWEEAAPKEQKKRRRDNKNE